MKASVLPPLQKRIRLVIGKPMAYDLYLTRFSYTTANAIYLDSYGQISGKMSTPDCILVVCLPGWQDWSLRKSGLFSAVCDWKTKWRDLGTEEISMEELDGGLPVRQANLLKKYQEMTDRAGTNYLAIESGKNWIRRLDQQDQDLLAEALGLREKGQEPAPKK